MHTHPGTPYPLGATLGEGGANFAIYSENAEAVELCLFDGDQETRIPVPNCTAFVWHVFVPGITAGQRYGYRVHGPYDPERGLRFNSEVVLLDPYARAVDGVERWEAGCFAHVTASKREDLERETRPVLGAPRGVVIDASFDWEGDEPLRYPLHGTVIYEAHVRGLTKLHPDVPEALRGTYASIAHPAIVRYLSELGITAIELMPIHAFVDDLHLQEKGLHNYWGYNSIGFFAPDVRYRASSELGGEVREFKSMVKALHRAGIEVILDVVYNHTAEGNHLGPTFSFKGIDNPTYYRLVAGEQRYYFDYTGTGNTLNVSHPQVLALIMDSLRYWASEMHVDGFRFDLASTLARQLHEVDRLSSFFTLIHQSPVLSHAKIIAEPWDVGAGGYQVGNFPVRWAEWNGRYRDAIRSLWRGDGGSAAEIGYRLTGSSDLYESSGRRPSASVNLITAHDGFTLRDLVSYERKHNDANLENNRDGAEFEHSFNCGVEGPTDDDAVEALRLRQQKNLLATLLLSQGTPMLLAGDEFGRSQQGNNNAYCQDNELSWLDWSWMNDEADGYAQGRRQRELFAFTRTLLEIRHKHPALRRSKFFEGRPIHGSDIRDLHWFRNDGQEMSEKDWHKPVTLGLAVFLAGRGIDDTHEDGRPIIDDDFLLLINASAEELPFTVPVFEGVARTWQLLIDTAQSGDPSAQRPGEVVSMPAHSLKFYSSRSRVLRSGGARHTLGATYRLQLHSGLDFRAASGLLDYVSRLGATDLYLSPIMAPVPGSTHGYDVVDHSRLNPELGGRSDFTTLASACRARGMGILLDWVPNHMGIASSQNQWFTDVLENGPSSLYADFFDIDWMPPKEVLRDKVLLPVLGDSYGNVLERGELRVVLEEGRLLVAYFDRRFPLGPKTTIPILARVVELLQEPDADAHLELESIVSSLRHMPDSHETAEDLRRERAREKLVASRRLRNLLLRELSVRDAMTVALSEFNSAPGASEQVDRLDDLLQRQAYRLAWWRVATEEINYRRFFDINDLGALRMESPTVFAEAHKLLMQLVQAEEVQALRLDHTDGLYDPAAYFDALQQEFARTVGLHQGAVSPDDRARPFPLLIEDILESHERLPSDWTVDGTTGYDFLASSLSLYVLPDSKREMTSIYRRFTGDHTTFQEHARRCKAATLSDSLAAEVNMLARQLERIASMNRRWRDFTLISLTRALVETITAFGVYRTYVREDGTRSKDDEREIRRAIERARQDDLGMSSTVFDFLESVLLLEAEGTEEERREHARFALRFQQVTGPVMAKSVEDTAFYRYGRLLCLNEVGASPAHWSTSVKELHAQNTERLRDWPRAMLSTSTHDTKRGEDAAMRIAVLSEMPDAWSKAVSGWTAMAEAERLTVEGVGAPSRRDEYIFYQAVVGAWPYGWDGVTNRAEFVERLSAYLSKATKEAKVHTSWTNPRPAYDEAAAEFPRRMFSREAFVGDMRRFVERLALHGATNSLARTLLKFTSPGVPDTYQGSEGWNQSLVDPDNRRMPDFRALQERLEGILERAGGGGELARDLLANYEDGGIKMYVTHVALEARRRFRDVFEQGDYRPIDGGRHVVAFERVLGERRFVVVTPRLSYTLVGGEKRWPLGTVWGRSTIQMPAEGNWVDVVGRREHRLAGEASLASILADLPIALLVREGN